MDLLNELPCPLLITTKNGVVVEANSEFLIMVGVASGKEDTLAGAHIESLLPPASKIFMQTHVWPMLLRAGNVNEIYLKFNGTAGRRIPVLTNCKLVTRTDGEYYYWIFMIALERSRFEEELLKARKRSEVSNLALIKSEQFVKTITNALPGLVAYWDKNLRCHFANDAFKEWYGIGPAIGQHLRDFMGDEAFQRGLSNIEAVLNTGEPQNFERTITSLQGVTRHSLVNFIPDKNVAGGVNGFFVLVSDVTLLKNAQAELNLASSVFQNTIESIMVIDEHGVILSANPAFTAMTGYSIEEITGQTLRFLKSNQHDDDFYSMVWDSIAKDGRWAGETWNRHKNGGVFLTWQTITIIRGDTDEAVRYVSVSSDITERWNKDERIRHLAFHDPLTDLPNRALLMERFGQMIAANAREAGNVALLFLDLDGFKAVNDTFGHEMGDAVLKIIAQKLLAEKRVSDTVARLGGDEFIILLGAPIDDAEVASIAQRLIALINEPISFRGKVVQLGASIGVAMYPADGHVPIQLMKRADSAMYLAKRAGKNTYRFFNPAIESYVVA